MGEGAVTADVFISYASQDASLASEVVETLERNGLRCWIAPRDVVPGAQYADSIILAITAAKALVLVLSDSALASQHVGKEIERASSKGRPIIALRTATAPLPPAFEYFLSESQWIDVGAGGVAAIADKLVEAVRLHLDRSVKGEARAHSDTQVPARGVAAPRSKWMLAVGAALVLLAVAYFAVNKWGPGKTIAEQSPASATAAATDRAAPAVSDKSVAVLPFLDMSEKKDQEYFADGLSEELINLLAKIPDLRVPARTSSFYFKGKNEDVATIARRLAVANVIEGSVRKSGKHIRVTAQLIRAESGFHVWSETYDREVDDIFKIQDEIAGAVVKALEVSLLEGQAPRATPVSNSEAYTLYLQARSIYTHGEKWEDGQRAMAALEQALKKDPQFVRAWAALCVYRVASYYYFLVGNYQEIHDRALFEAQKALELDPNLAESHFAMGTIQFWLDRDWPAAEQQLRRAHEIDPRNSEVLRTLTYVAATQGRTDEAVRYAQMAIERDPLYAYNFIALANAHLLGGRPREAEAAYRKAIDLLPDSAGMHLMLGWALLAKGDPTAALAEMQRETDARWRAAGSALALDALGRRRESDQVLKAALERNTDISEYEIAQVYASRSDLNNAFLWLDRANARRSGDLTIYFRGDPSLKNLRSDPRYKALLQKMKLTE